jgi:hypothetical protein
LATVEYAPVAAGGHRSVVVSERRSGFTALLVFRESRYDVCAILRGTPAPENALIACHPDPVALT